MSVRCRMVKGPGPGTKLKPGDMWFTPAMLENGFAMGYQLSDEYKRDWAGKRDPLWVILPSGTWFCVDSRTTDGDGHGWTVTGEPPNITVDPSINAVGLYHGWLKDGVLSDDVEGRAF